MVTAKRRVSGVVLTGPLAPFCDVYLRLLVPGLVKGGLAVTQPFRVRVGYVALLVGAQVSSRACGTNSRQSTTADPVSVAACTLTAIWQLATLPRVPESFRVTDGDALPSVTHPVSSTTYTRAPIRSTARAAIRRRTPATSQVEDVRNCCNCW